MVYFNRRPNSNYNYMNYFGPPGPLESCKCNNAMVVNGPGLPHKVGDSVFEQLKDSFLILGWTTRGIYLKTVNKFNMRTNLWMKRRMEMRHKWRYFMAFPFPDEVAQCNRYMNVLSESHVTACCYKRFFYSTNLVHSVFHYTVI